MRSGGHSWPWLAPAARLIDSFMSVPPRSLTPASSSARAPSGPSFTQEAWMFVHVRVEHEARGRVQHDGLAERRAVPRQRP